MAPFKPEGDRARWRPAYDLLRMCDVGGTVPYIALGEALGLDADADRHAIQMAVRRAAKELLLEDRRALEAVRNEGYRVTETMDRPRLVRGQGGKVKRALDRGHDLAIHVDYTGLDMEARRIVDAAAATFYGQLQVTKALLRRQSRLDEVLRNVASKQEVNAAELEEILERLRVLEERLNG